MKRIMFVCHGNICRSTMAEFVMADMVRRAGLEGPSLVVPTGNVVKNMALSHH